MGHLSTVDFQLLLSIRWIQQIQVEKEKENALALSFH